ncbi:MFS transporter [Rugosimonospora africana]|uniref:MFS transporter n=1 Tax=Rugosimonospora africana TaxID=556532 RepID=A0A8J3R1I1_9ACTN|nr:MFS transporter [Rugosimonospora africana]GIH18486.1 MFS transporter [Rugosimonospora africana]
MSHIQAPAATRAGGDQTRAPAYGWLIVAALSATTTVGYGVLYYAYAVFLTPMATALHTGTTVIAGALTCSVLASAAAAVPVGRWLDRHGGRALMTGGSVAATLLLLAWSRVHTVAVLYLVWTGIGVATACVLYEAAFAVVITWFRERRATALLAVTVVAGFASSIFLPLTGHLVDRYGWRDAILVLAAIHAAVTIPGHLLVRRPPRSVTGDREPAGRRKRANRSADDGQRRRRIVSTAVHDPGYWALAVAFVCSNAAVAAASVHLVAYLTELGHTPQFAATTAGLLGILSVTGRLATTATIRRASPATATAAMFFVQAVAAACLPVVGHGNLGAVVSVLGIGLGFGVSTIARPAILADRYGTAAYATISGILAVPLTVAKALAPLVAAAIRDATGDYLWVAEGIAGMCVVAGVALLAVRRLDAASTPPVERLPEKRLPEN